MKTLKTIQTLAKIGKIISKIIFICCIVGFCGCVVGIISLALGAEILKLGGVTIHSLIENRAGIYLGDIITSFHEEYPEVAIHIEGRWGADGLDRLESQNVDFALKMLHLDENKYEMIPIVDQELRLGVSKDHPLAKRKRVAFRELKDENFLTLSDDFVLHQQFMRNCEQAGFTPNIVLSSSDCDFLANMVSRNWGIFMTSQAVWDGVDCRNIRLLDITEADVSWNLVLASKKDRVMSNAGIAFAQQVKKFLKTHR